MSKKWLDKSWKLASVAVMGGAIAFASANSTRAQVTTQIVPDGTLGGENSRLLPIQDGFAIEGGATRGANLFHSFSQFYVGTRGVAYFNNNPMTIQNIITRVTGGSLSNIDGIIAANGGANLFLINPSGIVFGPYARLNIGGSFVASTANSVNFADGTVFSATNPQAVPPMMTINIPIGLQFGGSTGSITTLPGVPLQDNNGNQLPSRTELIVPPTKTLALIGGDVTLDNVIINVPLGGGLVQLGGLAGAGTVEIKADSNGNLLALQFPPDVPLANVSIRNESIVDVRGNNRGDISINARNIEISGRSIACAGIGIPQSCGPLNRTGLAGSPMSQAGNISLNATEKVTINDSRIENDIKGGATGNLTDIFQAINERDPFGSILIATGELELKNGAQISASTFGNGNAGVVSVGAMGDVTLNDGSKIFSTVDRNATGNAGGIAIQTDGSVFLTDNSVISASTFGNGNAGLVGVIAKGDVTINNMSRIGSVAGEAGIIPRGNAGGVVIDANRLFVRNFSEVSVNDQGTGEFLANLPANFNRSIGITARSILLDQGRLTAQTALSDGGNILIEVSDRIVMRGDMSAINASAAGTGGNIVINDLKNPKNPSGFLITRASDNSDIIARGVDQGGRIDIGTQSIFGFSTRRGQPSNDVSEINASSDFGDDGPITINTTATDPAQGLVNLQTNIVDPSTLIAQGCTPGQTGSQFINTGRGGLPPNPDDVLSSDAVWEDNRLPETTSNQQRQPNTSTRQSSASNPVSIVPARGWVLNDKGQVTLVAQTPVVTSDIPWVNSTSCRGK